MNKEAHTEAAPDADLLQDLERLQQYHDLNEQHLQEVRRTRGAWEYSKGQTKEARAEHDNAVAALLAFGNDQILPLLNEVDDEPEPPDQWRECQIGGPEFDLPPAIVRKLNNAQIETAGALSDFCKEHGEFWAQDIPGIGAKAQTAIEDAWSKFWEAHPEANDADGADANYDEAEQIAKTIATAPQDIATKAIAACTDIDILKAAASDVGWAEDWRRAEIAKRIQETEAA